MFRMFWNDTFIIVSTYTSIWHWKQKIHGHQTNQSMPKSAIARVSIYIPIGKEGIQPMQQRNQDRKLDHPARIFTVLLGKSTYEGRFLIENTCWQNKRWDQRIWDSCLGTKAGTIIKWFFSTVREIREKKYLEFGEERSFLKEPFDSRVRFYCTGRQRQMDSLLIYRWGIWSTGAIESRKTKLRPRSRDFLRWEMCDDWEKVGLRLAGIFGLRGVFALRNGSKSFWRARSRREIEVYACEKEVSSRTKSFFLFVYRFHWLSTSLT